MFFDAGFILILEIDLVEFLCEHNIWAEGSAWQVICYLYGTEDFIFQNVEPWVISSSWCFVGLFCFIYLTSWLECIFRKFIYFIKLLIHYTK